MSKLPEKIDIEHGDWVKQRRSERDIMDELVEAVNQIIDYLGEHPQTTEDKGTTG